MWLLLFGLTALVLVLPMLPAIAEWRRPSDIAPLHIDAHDALDPTWPARSAAARAFAAIGNGAARYDGKPLAELPADGNWPFRDDERGHGRSDRTWHTTGDAVLPQAMRFDEEVFARGALTTAAGGSYAALWSGYRLELAEGCAVARWAHAAAVAVRADGRLSGRVTADETIDIATGCRFVLLQAPTIRFAADSEVAEPVSTSTTLSGLPADVIVDEASGRGVCDSIDLGPRRAWRGDLVCRGDLVIGGGCRSTGNVKARGSLVVGPRVAIDGALVAEGSIELGEGSRVTGAVVSETVVILGPGCVVGRPGHPATVSAPRIVVAPGVVVHGTVWAEVEGHVPHPTVAQHAPQSRPVAVAARVEPLAA